MSLPNCSPSYSYRPVFTPSTTPCSAPGFPEHRSRAFPTNLFFRSKTQGSDRNQIAVECVGSLFHVYFNNIIVETYTITIGYGGITNLRSQISANIYSIIEMTALNDDIYDTRVDENDTDTMFPGGLSNFPTTSFSGGSGGPTDDSGLAAIRTGPDRSIIIITTTENNEGKDIDPPANKKVQQWTGTQWISYCNNVPGACPGEGVC